MFDPTKSDGRNSVNRREKREKKKKKKKKKYLSDAPSLSLSATPIPFVFFFFNWDPHVPFFFHFLIRFSPETIYFVPVSISFILIEYFFKYFPFYGIFQKSRFQVSLYTRRLEIRKIFRLFRNSMKFFWVTRFRETNLTTQSVSSS